MTTFERLCAILMRDYPLDPTALTPDASLEALGIDSLGVAELLFTVEDAFAVRLPPEPVALATLGKVVAYIDGLIAAQRPAGSDGAPEVDAPPAMPPATVPTATTPLTAAEPAHPPAAEPPPRP